MNEKALTILGTIGGIFGIFPILAWLLGGSNLQGNNRETLKTMTNLEICLIVCCVVLNFIPFVGNILAMVIGLANIVISIKAYTCINKEAFKIPIIEIVK